MSQQASSMKGKSVSTRANRASPRVSFTDNPKTNTPRRSSSHSNLSTPLTDSFQVISFEKVVGKVFNKGLNCFPDKQGRRSKRGSGLHHQVR